MRVLFHHPPKCGGMCVYGALQRQFKHCQFNAHTAQHTPDWQTVDATSFDSHFAFHPEIFSPQEGDFWFTWVRDPVDCFLSGYYFWRYGPHNWKKPPNPEHAKILSRIQKRVRTIHEWKGDAMSYAKAALDGMDVHPLGDFVRLQSANWDYVGRQWAMQEDLDHLMRKLGKSPVKMPVVNGSSGLVPRHEVLKEQVLDAYRDDLYRLFSADLEAVNQLSSRHE